MTHDPRAVRMDHLVAIGYHQGDRHTEDGKDQDPDSCSNYDECSGDRVLWVDQRIRYLLGIMTSLIHDEGVIGSRLTAKAATERWYQ